MFVVTVSGDGHPVILKNLFADEIKLLVTFKMFTIHRSAPRSAPTRSSRPAQPGIPYPSLEKSNRRASCDYVRFKTLSTHAVINAKCQEDKEEVRRYLHLVQPTSHCQSISENEFLHIFCEQSKAHTKLSKGSLTWLQNLCGERHGSQFNRKRLSLLR